MNWHVEHVIRYMREARVLTSLPDSTGYPITKLAIEQLARTDSSNTKYIGTDQPSELTVETGVNDLINSGWKKSERDSDVWYRIDDSTVFMTKMADGPRWPSVVARETIELTDTEQKTVAF